MHGYGFTWEWSRGSSHWVQEKMDRCFATADWLEVFPSLKLSNLFAATSDHYPILLQFSSPSRGNVSHRFRFENLWLREEEFVSSFEMWWGSSADISLVPWLSHCAGFMANWGRNVLQKFHNKLINCKVQVEQLRSSTNESRVIEFFNEKRCLAKLLEDEELYWEQQAKAFWLENGDLNTKFFHAQASGRKASNKVSSLIDVKGIVRSDLSMMGSIALSYFRNFFSSGLTNFDGLEISFTDVVSLEENESLISPFSKEEFTKAIKQMHPEKSPGPDGLNPGFYQRFWPLIGDQIFSATSQWLSTGPFPLGLNNTLIV